MRVHNELTFNLNRLETMSLTMADNSGTNSLRNSCWYRRNTGWLNPRVRRALDFGKRLVQGIAAGASADGLETVQAVLTGIPPDLRPGIRGDPAPGLVPRQSVLRGLRSKVVPFPVLASRGSRRFFLVYPIAQEALTSVSRHAHAKNIWVRLSGHGNLRLSIHDDGI